MEKKIFKEVSSACRARKALAAFMPLYLLCAPSSLAAEEPKTPQINELPVPISAYRKEYELVSNLWYLILKQMGQLQKEYLLLVKSGQDYTDASGKRQKIARMASAVADYALILRNTLDYERIYGKTPSGVVVPDKRKACSAIVSVHIQGINVKNKKTAHSRIYSNICLDDWATKVGAKVTLSIAPDSKGVLTLADDAIVKPNKKYDEKKRLEMLLAPRYGITTESKTIIAHKKYNNPPIPRPRPKIK